MTQPILLGDRDGSTTLRSYGVKLLAILLILMLGCTEEVKTPKYKWYCFYEFQDGSSNFCEEVWCERYGGDCTFDCKNGYRYEHQSNFKYAIDSCFKEVSG